MRFLFVLLALPLPLACSVSMTAPDVAGPMPSGSSAIVAGSDPICGAEHKWTGSRCSRDTAEDPTRKSGRLELVDVTTGSGPEVRPGDAVSVHYVGTLDDGTKFDSSRDAGKTLDFKIGMGQVIRGFERGIIGMKVGGIRKVTIPPELGYGRRGQPPVIPGNATLHFEIELMAIKN